MYQYLKKEDETGYEMQFRLIPKFTQLNCFVPTAMTRTLFTIISSCSTLWRIIDTKGNHSV